MTETTPCLTQNQDPANFNIAFSYVSQNLEELAPDANPRDAEDWFGRSVRGVARQGVAAGQETHSREPIRLAGKRGRGKGAVTQR